MQLNVKSTFPDSRHYYLLDIIRIFASILVLLNHFAVYSANGIALAIEVNRAYKFLEFFHRTGAVGVEIFFVISGLVIASSASRGSGLRAALNFIYRRGQRIIPTLWMSAGVSMVASYSIDFNFTSFVKPFIRSIFLFPLGPHIDGVVWSLIVEAFFYIVISATMLINYGNRLVFLAIFVAFISIMYNSIFFLYSFKIFGFTDAQILSSLNKFPYKILLLRYGVFFSLGISVYSLKNRINIFTTSFSIICFVFCIFEIISSSGPGFEKPFVAASIWILSLSVIIITSTLEPRICNDLPNKVSELLKYLGSFSYPLYLNHFTLGIVLTYHLRYLNSAELKFIICLFIIFAISAAILHIENRVNKLLFRKSNRNVWSISIKIEADRSLQGNYPRPCAERIPLIPSYDGSKRS